ncbi:major facilitator superfamily domain-containing protein 4A isoform X2 [Lissotriton helveticus]
MLYVFVLLSGGKRLKQSLTILFLSSLAISLVFAIIPFCNNVVALAVVLAVAGLAMGGIDTISNMQLVRIYQKDSAIFLQVLHFFLGCGALLSPLIADPFLSDTNCIQSNLTANSTANLEHIRNSLVPYTPRNLSRYALPQEGTVITNVSYAFWIMAMINLPIPLAVFFLLYKEGLVSCCSKKSRSLLAGDELAMETKKSQKDRVDSLPEKAQESDTDYEDMASCCQKKNYSGASFCYFALHVAGALVLFMSDGILGEYSAFVYSYAVQEPLSIGHKTAGYLPSLLWGFITLGRLVSIPASCVLRPGIMVLINLAGVVLTFLLLLISPYSTSLLFLGTASLGFFLSSTFPSMLAYTEDILNYKGCATTVLVTGAGIGEMVLQMLVGSVILEQGSYSFLVCGLLFGGMAFAFYLMFLCFHRAYSRPPPDPPIKENYLDESVYSYQR